MSGCCPHQHTIRILSQQLLGRELNRAGLWVGMQGPTHSFGLPGWDEGFNWDMAGRGKAPKQVPFELLRRRQA